jgi:DNA-binding beta-propeller fold protein YncE
MRISTKLALLAVVVATLASAAPALAARPHEFKEAFAPTGEHALKEPDGVAVNEATGDVYVVDKGNDRVEAFSAKGEYQFEFNGSGMNSNEGLLPPPGRFEKPETIAVDNSCAVRRAAKPELTQGECEAEDPSNGDVYVVDQGNPFEGGHLVVDKFSPTGAYLGQISGEKGGRFSPIDGVAVGVSGEMSLLQENETISKYSNAEVNELLGVDEITGFKQIPVPGSLAVDSKGDFYLLTGFGEATSGLVGKVSPTGAGLNEKLDEELSTAVAVDQRTDNAYICNTDTIAAFNPEGEMLERLGKENGKEHLSQCNGIGVNAGSGTLYASDAGTDTVVIFGQAQPTVPRVEEESFSEVTSQTATLAARINPQSEPTDAPTSYLFEYAPISTCPKLSTCNSASHTVVSSVAASFEPKTVSQEVMGLQAGVTYVFRAVARNSHNPEPEPALVGEERTFTTEGAGGELVLPDNRGWELVSPPQKQGALIRPFPENAIVQAAADGSGITYLAEEPTEANPEGYGFGPQVLSRRGAASWSSRDIAIPHATASGVGLTGSPEYKFFTADLSNSAVQPLGEFVPELSEEATESTAYLHDLSEGCGASCYHPLVTSKPGIANVPTGTAFGEEEKCQPKSNREVPEEDCGPIFEGASPDLRHVVLSSRADLVRGGGGLYEWNEGRLVRVSVLPGPGEEPAHSPGLGDENSIDARGAISTDGSRVFFSTAGGEGLYLRDTTRGETLQLDAGNCVGCESGHGVFQIASADGSRVFFTSQARLTEDSGAEPGAPDLYECRIPLHAKLACDLTDLTPPHAGESANVQSSVLGASEDGEYAYYVARGVQSETANTRGQKALPGAPNIYVLHAGATSFVTTLAKGDKTDWQPERLTHQPVRVSPDGQWLTLMSEASLTGYDNRDAATVQPVAEVYVYSAQSKKLECVSCLPSGARPTGIEFRKLTPNEGGVVGGAPIWPPEALVAANVPGWTGIGHDPQQSRYQPRYLNNEGRVFFNTLDALVPQDTNGTEDVYEYEPPGVGSCTEAASTFSARSGGCVSLISSGRSDQESGFLDASETGDDVFFITSAKLSPLDVDTAYDVYDAHVCTQPGEPCITFPTTQSPPCTTEASCKATPTPQPSVFGTPPSATFEGLGNPAPAAAAAVVTKKALTRPQKLAAALKSCKRDKKKAKRQGCEKQARKKYGPLKKVKKKTKK